MSPEPASTIVPDADKTREQLLSELLELRAQVAILREAEVKSKGIAEALRESEERLRLAQQAAHQSLVEKSRYLEAFFNHTITPLVLLDRDFNFIRVNEAYAKACQKDVDEFPGHNHFEFYPSDARAIFDDVVRTRQPIQVVARPFVFPDHPDWGVTYWNWTLTPLLDDRGEVEALVFALEDVTEPKRNEFELEKHHDKLQELVQERTRDLEAANNHLCDEITERKRAEEELKAEKQQAELYLDLMGHDINNLHQIALGYLELARDMPAGEEHAVFLDKPVEVLQRSAKLISNVRKLQKLHDGMFQDRDVDMCEVLSDVQREFGAVPNKTVTLSLNGFERCHVHANELLHDVFANLVGNAVKHTGDRADIVVDLDVVEDDGGRYCRVMVEDDGPGIPDDFKATIFNRALKSDSKAKGMGLGLYLVKSLVDSYDGRVWVEDRIQGDHTKGARFVVMLPAVDK